MTSPGPGALLGARFEEAAHFLIPGIITLTFGFIFFALNVALHRARRAEDRAQFLAECIEAERETNRG